MKPKKGLDLSGILPLDFSFVFQFYFVDIFLPGVSLKP
jgi:hypothetical protein